MEMDKILKMFLFTIIGALVYLTVEVILVFVQNGQEKITTNYVMIVNNRTPEIMQQACQCEIIREDAHRKYPGVELFHPIQLDQLGEFQVDLKLKGFNEDDVGIVVFNSDKDYTNITFMVELGLYKRKDVIIYNSTWHQLANGNIMKDQCNLQVSDWASFYIRISTLNPNPTIRVSEATTGKLIVEASFGGVASVKMALDSIKYFKVTKKHYYSNNLEIARRCVYSHSKQRNSEYDISRDVKACGIDGKPEEFYCEGRSLHGF